MGSALPPVDTAPIPSGRRRPAPGQGLVAATAALSRALQESGIKVGLRGLLDALRAAALVGPESGPDLRRALAANLVASPQEEQIFNRLFDRLFLGLEEEPQEPETGPGPQLKPQPLSLVKPAGQDDDLSAALTPYSPEEVLAHKDLRQMSQAEIDQVFQLLAQRLAQLLVRPSRRFRPRGRRARIDFRRTWRQSLPLGGEILRLAHARRRIKLRRLIFLLDVSGSMENHTRSLLLFARAWLKARPGKVEVLAFSTRLKRLTPLLADLPWPSALDKIGRLMPEWSGGTRIGQALKELLAGFGRGLVGPSSLVVVASDGWDRGQIDLLKRQMARLKRRARRVIWLNPLMGAPDYEPLCAGMRAALPHLDRLLPAHSLDSLVKASDVLQEALA